jgi:hypothetical protein
LRQDEKGGGEEEEEEEEEEGSFKANAVNEEDPEREEEEEEQWIESARTDRGGLCGRPRCEGRVRRWFQSDHSERRL